MAARSPQRSPQASPSAPLTKSADATPAVTANPWAQAYAYGQDAWQRSVLYWDVMRQRGNQYLDHMAKKSPNVLSMPYESILDGRDFERPVNYGLLRILPPEGVVVDHLKRPFLVVDPRAGHGPGIGGFKPESEIGVAVKAGHPCYFATFLPEPTPTQTVEDVIRAECRFLEEIIERHPEAEGKPVVVGNCQAGWQIMMAAALKPELFGPIIIAGAPLSYWAGWRGKNPMRYSGGMLGGSWLTAFAGDLGAGRFDGAWLVQNFEGLNPANTLWGKQYNLYANVDTEAERYLSFEKWWGGHVFLNAPEIQYIVDNLFIGNRLSTGGLVTSDGVRIDLRNIRSPIIVFCSKGDNITPPPQALGWIPDLYEDDAQLRAHGQTIVYAVHESIGHLGIFVSSSVARKEHQEFTANIDIIDVLPPGLYQAEIADKTPETRNADSVEGDYVLSFARRKIDDVRAIVEQEPEDDQRFAAVARISDINLGLYRSFVQPWVKAAITPEIAETLQRLHPLRLPYEMLSDQNPLIEPVRHWAEQIRADRVQVDADNPFLLAEHAASDAIEKSLDTYRITRDDAMEAMFMSTYGSHMAQDWAGLGAREGPARPHPGVSPEHKRFMVERMETLRNLIPVGGVREAALRMLIYVTRIRGDLDERSFSVIRRMRADKDKALSLQTFKDVVRDQALMLMLDKQAAIDAIPKMLENASAADIRQALSDIEEVLDAGEPLDAESLVSVRELANVFLTAAERAKKKNTSKKPATKQAHEARPGTDKVASQPGSARPAQARPAQARPAAARSAASREPDPTPLVEPQPGTPAAPTVEQSHATTAAKTAGSATRPTKAASTPRNAKAVKATKATKTAKSGSAAKAVKSVNAVNAAKSGKATKAAKTPNVAKTGSATKANKSATKSANKSATKSATKQPSTATTKK